MSKGLFISVEGIDGVGKSTHVNFIKKYLELQNYKVILTREPGGTILGEEIRQILLHSHNMQRITELLLMFASRQELITNIIMPNLENGVCVVADRFVDASLAYQGVGRDIGIDKVKKLFSLLEPNITTDLTFLFEVPLEKALNRINRASRNKDRIEKESEEFFGKVQAAYRLIAKEEPDRIKIISTEFSIEESQKKITDYLNVLININKNK